LSRENRYNDIIDFECNKLILKSFGRNYNERSCHRLWNAKFKSYNLSEKDKVLAAEKVDFEPYYSRNIGWAEQSPEMYWESLAKATQQLKENFPNVFNSIEAVTLTTQRATIVVVDQDGNPLRDAFIWLDEREAVGKPKLYFHEKLAFWLIKNFPQLKWHTEEARPIG